MSDEDRIIYEQRYHGIYLQTKQKIMADLIKREIYLRLEDQSLGDELLQNQYNIVKELQDHKDKKNDKLDSQYIFITLSPRPDVSLSEFKKVIEKIFSKKWQSKYIYVIEQRGSTKDDCGKGIHLHSLIHRNDKKFSEIKREIHNTFKRLYDEEVYSAFDVKLVDDSPDNLSKIINYMLGEKATADKQLKQVQDKIFREREKIKPYYVIGEWQDIILCQKIDTSSANTAV